MNALSASQILSIAQQHLQAGRAGECDSLCRTLLKPAPRDPDVLHLLALSLAHRGQDEAAISYLKRAIAIADRMDFHRNLGAMHARREEWPLARASYQRASELAPEDMLALVGLGKALLEEGDSAGACSTLERALALEPDAISATAALADATRRGGDAARAVEICRQSAARGLDDAELQIRLGQALLDVGEESNGLSAAPAGGGTGRGERPKRRGPWVRRLGRRRGEWGPGHQPSVACSRPASRRPAAKYDLGNAATWKPVATRRPLKPSHRPSPADPSDEFATGIWQARFGLIGFRMADRRLHARSSSAIRIMPPHGLAWASAIRASARWTSPRTPIASVSRLSPTHSSAMNNLAMLIKDQGEVDAAIELLPPRA